MMVIDVPKFDSYSKDYEDYILGLIEKLKDSFDSNLLEHPDFFLELKKAICSDGKFELSGECESLVVSSVRDFPDDTNGYYKGQEISKKTTIKLDGTNLDYLRVENVEMSLFSFDSKDKKEISLAFDVFLYKQGMEEANLSYQRGNRVLMKGASLGPELSLIQELGKVSLNGFGRMPETSDKIPSWLYLRNRSSKFKNIVLVGGEKKDENGLVSFLPKRYVKSDPKYNRDLLDGASSVIMTYDNEKRCWIDINGKVLSDEEMHLLLETANTEITRGIKHQN